MSECREVGHVAAPVEGLGSEEATANRLRAPRPEIGELPGVPIFAPFGVARGAGEAAARRTCERADAPNLGCLRQAGAPTAR